MAILVTCSNCKAPLKFKNDRKGQRSACPKCQAGITIDGAELPDWDVFVSYSHHDKNVADAVVTALESRKISCWIAPRNVPAGGVWAASIINAIDGSRVMVLIYSQQSDRSRQVIREVERAVAKGLVVIPLRIEKFSMSAEMEYFLSATHWLDAADESLNDALAGLVQVVTAVKQAKLESPLQTIPRRKLRVRSLLLPTLMLFAGLLLGYVTRWQMEAVPLERRTQKLLDSVLPQLRTGMFSDEELPATVIDGKIALTAPYVKHLEMQRLLTKLAPNGEPIEIQWSRPSPAFLRTVKILDQSTEMELIDTAVMDALVFLHELHAVEIIWNKQEIEEEGISGDTFVTVERNGITLRDGLSDMLKPLGLGFYLTESGIAVTSLHVAKESQLTAVYDVTPVISGPH